MASTITRSDGSFTLPPQTTPFSLAWKGQAGDNPCAYASVFCPTAVNQVPPGAAVDHLQCTQGFTTTSSEITTRMNQCFPANFFNLFRDDYADAAARFPVVQDVLTAAYPGDQCIHGWSTACEALVTQTARGAAAATQSQAWCCAPGYQCTTRRGTDDDATAGPGRICYLEVTTPTEVWASFDPPVETGGSEFYVYKYSLSSAPSKSANMIYHNPLPLALDKGQHVSGVPTIKIDYTVPEAKAT